MTKLSLIGATQTLNEQFTKMPAWRKGAVQVGAPALPLNDPSFSWAAGYVWDHGIIGSKQVWPDKTNFPAFTSNGAADADPDGDLIAQTGISPFSLTAGGGVTIQAKLMPASLKPLVAANDAPATFLSGCMNSYPYVQQYGYFTMKAWLPKGKGLWPAFWLLPYDLSWPPEIDIMEVLGADPTIDYFTLHPSGAAQIGNFSKGVDLSLDYHDYGLDWGPETIAFYLDGNLMWQQPTPASMKRPFYILANLGVGKSTSWGGAPDANEYLQPMHIKSIQAYQRPEYLK